MPRSESDDSCFELCQYPRRAPHDAVRARESLVSRSGNEVAEEIPALGRKQHYLIQHPGTRGNVRCALATVE